MRIHDPIYGQFDLPGYLVPLVCTPEVRRLSQIRLLNTLSPTLATLSDIRRYSHTLGVLYLFTRRRWTGFSPSEERALAATILLHDVGTPPFGHLLEYHLRDRFGWSHETIVPLILSGTHAPENVAHQLFSGHTISFRKELHRSRIDLDLVRAMLKGDHPLSRLVFGTIDLDNIDNVARMAWALGLATPRVDLVGIAGSLNVSPDGRLLLSEEHQPQVETWSSLRREVYDVLAFDPQTVAAQAVLSEAIATGFQLGYLELPDWSLADEDLLARLRSHRETRRAVDSEYLGQLPHMLFAVQVAGTLGTLGYSSRSAAAEDVQRELLKDFGSHALASVFVDQRTWGRRLKFHSPVSGRDWHCGVDTQSVVFYGLHRGSRRPGKGRIAKAANDFAATLSARGHSILRFEIPDTAGEHRAQRTITFAS